MSRYHLVFDEDEKYALILSLAHKIGCAAGTSVVSGEYKYYLNLMRRLLEVPQLPEPQASAPSARAAVLPHSPTAPERDPPIPRTPEVRAERLESSPNGDVGSRPGVPIADSRPDLAGEKKETPTLGELVITPTKVDQPLRSRRGISTQSFAAVMLCITGGMLTEHHFLLSLVAISFGALWVGWLVGDEKK